MSRLVISGEYPPDWKEISDRVWAEAGHRCIRCLHPYIKGIPGNAEWSPCDDKCNHFGPIGARHENGTILALSDHRPGAFKGTGLIIVAQWRVATVHHLDGNKANCVWWNLLALCQRCHLTVQSRVLPDRPWILEHSDWFKPYVAGFYAQKYLGREITRAEAEADLNQLLALERLA